MIHFDIEWKELEAIGNDLGASEKQILFALNYALRRTASRLRALSTRGLKTELELEKTSVLRKRLRSIKLRKGAQGDGVKLWYGLNDMPVSWFKGKPTQTATGAEFRGQKFPGAFVARSQFKNKDTIFKRKGAARLHIAEQLLAIEDKTRVFIEDRIFVQVEDIFWPIFKREINARVKYSIGES